MKNKVRYIVNPFYLYPLSFLFVIFIYLIGWSDLYPPLSLELYVFLSLTSVISVSMGILNSYFKPIKIILVNQINYLLLLTIVVISLLIVEIIYNKTIPLYEILKGNDYDVKSFTFPLLHLVLTSLSAFLASLSFYKFIILDSKRRTSMIFLIINLLPAILLVQRSVLIIIILNLLFLFVLLKKINIKKILFIFLFFSTIMFGFGIVGDLRTQSQSGDHDRDFTLAFMKATDATDEAINSDLVKKLYWTYLYISSPLANLQNTINLADNDKSLVNNMVVFINLEVLPDIISKRINNISGESNDVFYIKRIVPFLTVGTIYAQSYGIIGWFGPTVLFLLLIGTITIYIHILPKNEYYMVGIATLSTLTVLCIFTNMLSYTPLSIQLLYPLLFTLLKRKKNYE